MNKKAFTIVELLAVVVMISVLSVIIMPLISNYLEKSKEEYNLKLKQQMLISGKNYYSDNKDKLPTDNSAKTVDYVMTSELASLKYLDGTFKDADDNNCMDRSYVVAINDGNGSEYYPCMICGSDENKYITEKEKKYCDRINNLESDNLNTGNPKNPPTCEVLSNSAKVTDEGVELEIEAGDSNGYITEVYAYNESGERIDYLNESEIDKDNHKITKTIKFDKYGIYKIVAKDNNNLKVNCSQFTYEKPKTTPFKYKMYFVSKEQYDNLSDKNTGFSDEELSNLEEYSGNEWKSGYAYVKLNYATSHFKSLKLKIGDSEQNIKGKKHFFIANEGEITSEVIGQSVLDKTVTSEIKTKLDRQAPSLSINNPSASAWKNVAVDVKVTYSDNHSKVKSIEYNDGSGWVNTWTSTGTNTVTKNWSRANRNLTMKIRAEDNAGNKVETSTPVRIDITPPYLVSRTYAGYGYAGERGYVYLYTFGDNLSGFYKVKWGHCYTAGVSTSSSVSCSYRSLTSRFNAATYQVRNWSGGETKRMVYKVARPATVAMHLSICDTVGNCATIGTYYDSY